jgi:hypothetical protein
VGQHRQPDLVVVAEHLVPVEAEHFLRPQAADALERRVHEKTSQSITRRPVSRIISPKCEPVIQPLEEPAVARFAVPQRRLRPRLLPAAQGELCLFADQLALVRRPGARLPESTPKGPPVDSLTSITETLARIESASNVARPSASWSTTRRPRSREASTSRTRKA